MIEENSLKSLIASKHFFQQVSGSLQRNGSIGGISPRSQNILNRKRLSDQNVDTVSKKRKTLEAEQQITQVFKFH